jgi:hypothetical protein
MKSRIALATLCLLLTSVTAFGQLTRVNDRTWAALRGGLFIGTNQSFHVGDVPITPNAENTVTTTGHGSNFTIGGIIEKPMSRSLTLGLRACYDPMSGDFDATTVEPFRVADGQGTVYNLSVTNDVQYTLHYFTLGGFVKLYPMQGPGFYLETGLNLTALLRDMYYDNTTTVAAPAIYKGATESIDYPVSDANAFRASLDVGVGYEFYVRSAFISPEIHYDLGLNKVLATSWSDQWSINNVRILLTATFPLVII